MKEEIDAFFEMYPNVEKILQVGTKLYLISKYKAAKREKNLTGEKLQIITNPSLNKK